MKVRNVANTANLYKAHRKVCIGQMGQVLRGWLGASGSVTTGSTGEARQAAGDSLSRKPPHSCGDGGELVSVAAI